MSFSRLQTVIWSCYKVGRILIKMIGRDETLNPFQKEDKAICLRSSFRAKKILPWMELVASVWFGWMDSNREIQYLSPILLALSITIRFSTFAYNSFDFFCVVQQSCLAYCWKLSGERYFLRMNRIKIQVKKVWVMVLSILDTWQGRIFFDKSHSFVLHHQKEVGWNIFYFYVAQTQVYHHKCTIS